MKLSICIVTSGIKGPLKFGGIATAFHNLSIFLAESGNQVSVLYVNHPYYYSEDYDYWRNYYNSFGVNLLPLEKPGSLYGTREMQESYYVYRHLKENEKYDVVIFHDLKGTAYYSLLAKKLQICFNDTLFLINSHASTKLSDFFNARPISDRNSLARQFLEKSSLEMADLVVSPSRFYLDWMGENGICLDDEKKTVIQNLLYPVPPDPGAVKLNAGGQLHFCFFSRLDTLKGIFVFIEAFDKLFKSGADFSNQLRITFVGDPVEINDRPSLDIIQKMTKAWPVKVSFETDLSTLDAMDYLKKQNGIVISSTLGETSSYIIQECLSYGIPTLASNLPNIRELIHEDFHSSHLFTAGDPDDLLRLVMRTLKEGIDLPQLKVSHEASRIQWMDLLKGIAEHRSSSSAVVKPTAATSALPLVSIIIPTYNRRSSELKETINSLVAQSYKNIEIIIAHDGAFEISDKETIAEIISSIKKAGIACSVTYREKSYKPQVCNQAAIVANGKYLCFFDDDDIAMPNMIEEFARVAEMTGCGMVTDFAQNFTVDNEEGARVPWCLDKVTLQNISLSLGNSMNVGFYQHFFGKANIFLRKDVYDAVGGMTVSEIKTPYIDWDLYVKVALAGYGIEVIPEVLYYYRMHSNESIYYTTHSQERFDSFIHRYHGHLKIINAYSRKYPEIAGLLEFAHFRSAVPKITEEPTSTVSMPVNQGRKKINKSDKGLVTKIYFTMKINKSKGLRKLLRKTGSILAKIGADFQNLSSLEK